MNDRQQEHQRLEESLAIRRVEFQAAMGELKESAQAMVAPRGIVARHPYPAIGLAFLVGFWIGWR